MARNDPSKTTTLRKEFRTAMRVRFRAVKRAVRELVVEDDVFGLDVDASPFSVNVEKQAWRFRTDAQKLESFRKWLQQQIDQRLLSVEGTGEPWTQKYVQSAYKKGLDHAFTEVNKVTEEDALDFFAGSKQEFLRSAFAQPETLSKVQLLATRSFEELRGVTAAMAQELNRALADGIAQGTNPKQIASAMAQRIDGLTKRRAETIARTEVIHAHAEGQLDGYEELGVEELQIMAEWSTAGDDRVCPLCRPLDGEVLTVEQARGLIPRHPNCRCAWIPAQGEPTRAKRRKLKKSLSKSIAAGGGVAGSTWAGKDVRRGLRT